MGQPHHQYDEKTGLPTSHDISGGPRVAVLPKEPSHDTEYVIAMFIVHDSRLKHVSECTTHHHGEAT